MKVRWCAAAVLTLLGLSAATSPPALVVRAGPAPGAIAVTNTTTVPQRVSTTVIVEGRAANGGWKPVQTELHLVRACDPEGTVRPLPAFVLIPARSAIRPPPWLGNLCHGQCNLHCRMDLPWGRGPFRFRLSDGAGRAVYSNIFVMPAVAPGPPL